MHLGFLDNVDKKRGGIAKLFTYLSLQQRNKPDRWNDIQIGWYTMCNKNEERCFSPR
jgi:hypothetical protein